MVNNFRLAALPRHCALCGLSASADLCPACNDELPRILTACIQCGIPLQDADLCGRCLIAPPNFARCIGALRYEPPISHLLGAFKYQSDFNSGRVLSQLLIECLRRQESFGADVIVPVPLHWLRRWTRGFNQAELIADEVSGALRIPIRSRWVRRVRASPPQQSLDADARQHNLRDAFACVRPLDDLRVAVIDDVVTTGATANVIAQTLLDNGAASVQIWCLARTP